MLYGLIKLEKLWCTPRRIFAVALALTQSNYKLPLTYCLIFSNFFTETKQQELLPKSLQTALRTPKGCCNHCKKRYYMNAFFTIYDNIAIYTETLMEDKLWKQIKNTACYFIFSYCSYNCLKRSLNLWFVYL